MKLRKEQVDMQSLVLKVVGDMKLSTTQGKPGSLNPKSVFSTTMNAVEIVFEKDHKVPMPVIVDPGRISQVLSNLIANALAFTKDNRVSITAERRRIATTVSTNKNNKESEEIAVTVSDTGTGIDAEVLPRLFEKFITKSDRGTGLGLYISKGIIEAHGGRIFGKNNEGGKGASFTFIVPM
jgi:signal transduction histidine kinase